MSGTSPIDEFVAIFDDLPPEERLRAAYEAIIELVAQGRLVVVYIQDDDDYGIYHIEHSTDAELEHALSPAELRAMWFKEKN